MTDSRRTLSLTGIPQSNPTGNADTHPAAPHNGSSAAPYLGNTGKGPLSVSDPPRLSGDGDAKEGIVVSDPFKRRLEEEVKLDEKILATYRKGPEDYSPEDWQGLREQLRLKLLYPGKFVAFRDHHDEAGRLIYREVVHSSRSQARVQKFVLRLPEKDQRGIYIDRVQGMNVIPRG